MNVQISLPDAAHVTAPSFTVCPSSGTSTCTIGTLPAGQADELQATARVHNSAVSGQEVKLLATASATGSTSYHASAATEVVAAPAPAPPVTSAPPIEITLPPVTLPAGTLSNGGNPAGLFPTVSPEASTSPSPSARAPRAPATVRHESRTRVTTVSAIVPLDSRLIGGQLVGLAVLAGAIVIAMARLSLRKTRPHGGPDGTGSGS